MVQCFLNLNTVLEKWDHIKIEKMWNKCHNPPEIVEISQNPDNDGLKSTHQKSGVFLNELYVNIWSYLRQYLEFRAKPRLYIHVQDIPRATRVFLVDIMTSVSQFRPIFTSGVPCDTSEMSVRDRSWDTIHSTKMVFRHHILSVIVGDELI